MSAILKFDFQKREQLRFSEVNYLNYTKRPNFACGNYIFPETKGNKNKPWTHSTLLKDNEMFRNNITAIEGEIQKIAQVQQVNLLFCNALVENSSLAS